MANRYELNVKVERLRALLAKAMATASLPPPASPGPWISTGNRNACSSSSPAKPETHPVKSTDRMPAFLTEDLWQDWLSIESLTVPGDTAASKQNRLEMIDALTASSESIARTMQTYEVDRRVNNSRTVDPTDPTIIEPLT